MNKSSARLPKRLDRPGGKWARLPILLLMSAALGAILACGTSNEITPAPQRQSPAQPRRKKPWNTGPAITR